MFGPRRGNTVMHRSRLYTFAAFVVLATMPHQVANGVQSTSTENCAHSPATTSKPWTCGRDASWGRSEADAARL